ncbi:unnamed protein product [Sphagnum tenellum]
MFCAHLITGKGVQACAVDPGAVASDIWKRTKYNRPPWKWLAKIAFAPTWDGALPVLHAATTPLVHDDAQLQNTTASLRLFARGAFAWPMVVAPTLSEFVLVCAVALDWQIRNLSSYCWGRRRRRKSTNRSGSSRFFEQLQRSISKPDCIRRQSRIKACLKSTEISLSLSLSLSLSQLLLSSNFLSTPPNPNP